MSSAFRNVLLGLSAAFVAYAAYKLSRTTPVEALPETWWGPGAPGKDDTAIKPFKIQISDKVLDDLKQRLSKARDFTPPLEGVQQQYGVNTNLLREIVDFWKTKYDWREREKFLNQYPQFKTQIQGLDIHFLHVKPSKVPEGVKVLPLLMLHGWPGSVREFYELVPLMTTPQKDHDFVFELIIPSLPGYGFSQAASRPGLGAQEMAVVFNGLMKRVGLERYHAQGGDWGSLITSEMALQFPDRVKGIHLNSCLSTSLLSTVKHVLGSFWPRLVVSEENEHRLYPVSEVWAFNFLEFGYMHLQATKPDTVGVGLNDSPVGLAAYILEKFITWTNPDWRSLPDGGLARKYTYTNLLDNVMIYWVTGSITTSARLYAESANKKQNVLLRNIPVQVPTACGSFDKDIVYQTETLYRDRYPNLVHAKEYSGGHFAAFEVPEVLAQDIWAAISKMEANKNETV